MLCDVMSFHVSPVLLCTTKYYASTTKYYSSTTKHYPKVLPRVQSSTGVLLQVLLHYYSVLQSTSPVLLRTTNSVLESTTPVLLRTTKYYSSTTPYNKAPLQYYSVLQSTSPVLLRTTKYYSSTTPYYKVLLQYNSVLEK